MKQKWFSVACLLLTLLLLAACQKNSETPYVTNNNLPEQTLPQSSISGQLPSEDANSTEPSQATEPVPPGSVEDDDPTQWPQNTQPQQGQQGSQGQQGGQGNQGQQGSEDFVLPTPETCTYEQYQDMTGAQQQAFFEQFNGDYAAFFEWLNAAQAEYEANQDDIILDPDTTIDWDSIFGKEG